MTEQQITEFDRWFDQFLDPELNLTPGDKELCRHAWQAALSHAEGEAVEIEAPEFHAEGMGCGLEDRGITDRYEAMEYGFNEAVEQYEAIIEGYGQLYTHPAPQVVVPEEAIAEVVIESDYWNRGHFHEGRKKEIRVLKELRDIPVGTLLYFQPTPDEREIAAKALDRHVVHLQAMGERDARNNDHEGLQTWEDAAYFARQEAARARREGG